MTIAYNISNSSNIMIGALSTIKPIYTILFVLIFSIILTFIINRIIHNGGKLNLNEN